MCCCYLYQSAVCTCQCHLEYWTSNPLQLFTHSNRTKKKWKRKTEALRRQHDGLSQIIGLAGAYEAAGISAKMCVQFNRFAEKWARFIELTLSPIDLANKNAATHSKSAQWNFTEERKNIEFHPVIILSFLYVLRIDTDRVDRNQIPGDFLSY